MTLPPTIRVADDGRSLIILDQTELPERVFERTLEALPDVVEAIQSLRVRGAPLIGITAARAVGVLARAWLEDQPGRSTADLAQEARAWCATLAKARPTAVNLTWALARMERVLDGPDATDAGADPTALVSALEAEGHAIHEEDREMCRRIGEHGLSLLAHQSELTLMTHCNAGALATGGIGTALAPIHLSAAAGLRPRVIADETRPLLQGSRLTAWELGEAGIDVTVVTDSTAASVLASGQVDAVLVGSDRIAANGDVANKIGTYGLAVAARFHQVPFYVLAPTSTVDLDTPDGAGIPIERRDADEVRRGFGTLTAPVDVDVWSPAFDVTPASLVTAIVTEMGVHRAPYGAALADAVAQARAAQS